MSLSQQVEEPDTAPVDSGTPEDDFSATSSGGWSSRSSRSPTSMTNDQDAENDGKWEWETVSDGHSGGSDQNPNKMHLLEQLNDARSRHDKLKQDYTNVVADSRTQIDELEKENQKLRSGQGQALSLMARESETTYEALKLKEENESLRKALEKQQALMTLSSAKYEKLRSEHSYTVQELQSKSSRCEQLLQDYNNVAYRTQDAEDYRQLEEIHNTVVMKLADMGEDNENLQKEKDHVTEQLKKANSQLQAYDETVLELDKVKISYTRVEEKYQATALQLEQLTEQHERVKSRLIEEISLKTYEEHEKLQQDYAEAMARLEILQKSNEELGDVDAKLNASEVRATMLETDLDQTSKKLVEAKKKQEEREIQLREVIAQYKSLKRDNEDLKTKFDRLKVVVDSDKRTSMVATASSTPDSNNFSGSDSTGFKTAATTAKIVAYEGQIAKLQQQRDAALEQTKVLEEDLAQVKGESHEAIEAKQLRERDLKIVLQHYEKLQTKYEATSQQLEEIVQKYQETVRKIDLMDHSIHRNRAGAREIESLPNWNTNEDFQQRKIETQNEGNVRNCASIILSDEVSVGKIESPHDEIDSTHRSVTNGPTNEGVEERSESHSIDDNGDDGSIAQLLKDMEHMKRQNAERTHKSAEIDEQQKDDSCAVMQVESQRKVTGNDSSSTGSRANEAIAAPTDILEQAKEISAWKDDKIARVLCELKTSQELVELLKSEKCQMEDELSTLQSQVLLAKLETSKAEERHGSRETHLRTAIANHLRLQQAYDSLNSKFEKVQLELAQAQKETKIKEEEAKGVRKRASSAHAQYKKLQTDHSAVLERLEKLEQELIVYMEASLCVGQQEY
jgi:chromosome segregation ATPase